MPMDMALRGGPTPTPTPRPMDPMQGPPMPMRMQLNGQPAPTPTQRPNVDPITTGSTGGPRVSTAPLNTPAQQGTGTGLNYYPPAPEPRRSIMNSFGEPVSEGVQRRAWDLQDFHAGKPLHRGAQFGNQALAEALMKRKQIGQR